MVELPRFLLQQVLVQRWWAASLVSSV